MPSPHKGSLRCTRASVQRLLDLLVDRFVEVTPGRRGG